METFGTRVKVSSSNTHCASTSSQNFTVGFHIFVKNDVDFLGFVLPNTPTCSEEATPGEKIKFKAVMDSNYNKVSSLSSLQLVISVASTSSTTGKMIRAAVRKPRSEDGGRLKSEK